METRIVSGDEFVDLADRMILTGDFFAAVTIGSVTIRNCDEGVVFADDPVRGIATIAPRGEMGNGEPTIVGVYVRPADRKSGYGAVLLAAAIRRCVERGFGRVRYDALTKGGKAVLNKLPPELLAHLDVRDQSHLSPF